MAIKGFFLSKSGMLITILAICVVIPLIMVKIGIENAYTDFFVNSFTSFTVIFLLGIITMNRMIRGNVFVATFVIAGIAAAAYLYVYALIL